MNIRAQNTQDFEPEFLFLIIFLIRTDTVIFSKTQWEARKEYVKCIFIIIYFIKKLLISYHYGSLSQLERRKVCWERSALVLPLSQGSHPFINANNLNRNTCIEILNTCMVTHCVETPVRQDPSIAQCQNQRKHHPKGSIMIKWQYVYM